jgi:hypothetical protein
MIRRPGPGAMPVENDRARDTAGQRETESAAEEVRETLTHLVKEAGARCALLLGHDGRVLAEAGHCAPEIREDVRAGAASSFEVARVMRSVLGREGVLVETAGALVEVTPVNDALVVGTAYDRAETLADVRAIAARAAADCGLRLLLG